MFKTKIVGYSRFTAKSGVEYYSYQIEDKAPKNWNGDIYTNGLIPVEEYGEMSVGDTVLVNCGYGNKGRTVFGICKTYEE